MKKIDLANPKTDVEKLYSEFIAWYYRWDRIARTGQKFPTTLPAPQFDNINISVWLSGNYDIEDAEILLNVWEKCGFIKKISHERYHNYESVIK